MSRKTALVTGASSGIGRATTIVLAESGYDLILLARRRQKLLDLQAELGDVRSHLMVCDINSRGHLTEALADLPKWAKDIDVLINNAGLALGLETADKTDWADWQTMIETNCMSLAFMTRQILPKMVARDSGHIVNVGSIAGNYAYKGGNVYGASKAFVEQFSRNLRADLLSTSIRVCNLAPGLIGETEFSTVRFHGDESKASTFYSGCQPLTPYDIAESIRWILAQPAHVNINQLEMMPVCQASAGLAVHKN
ncbi:MAG: SDR family NAD(P)-dependent oxidoreductase [Gammaproteobacteria bacterium]|nr:SDR family NAD(P)-dependent oxidoreductase [Gammaproteobacteria bacterium]